MTHFEWMQINQSEALLECLGLKALLKGTSREVMREGQVLLFHFPHPNVPWEYRWLLTVVTRSLTFRSLPPSYTLFMQAPYLLISVLYWATHSGFWAVCGPSAISWCLLALISADLGGILIRLIFCGLLELTPICSVTLLPQAMPDLLQFNSPLLDILFYVVQLDPNWI